MAKTKGKYNKNKPGEKNNVYPADAENMQNNYCKLVNNDFEGAMKILFEEVPGENKKQDEKNNDKQ